MPGNTPSPAIAPESLARRHETSDHNPRNVLIIAASAAALIVLSLIAAAILSAVLIRHHPVQHMQPLGILTAPNLAPLARFPGPDLTVDDDHNQMLSLRAAQETRLNSYGWVDRSNGIVHIPIACAMDLILQRGLPTRTNMTSTVDGSPAQLIQNISQQR